MNIEIMDTRILLLYDFVAIVEYFTERGKNKRTK